MKTFSGPRIVMWLLSAMLLTQSAAFFTASATPTPNATRPADLAQSQTSSQTSAAPARLVRLKDQLQYQQTRLERLSLAIPARPVAETDATPTPTTQAAEIELGQVAAKLGQLQTDLDQFKQTDSTTTAAPSEPTTSNSDGVEHHLIALSPVVQPGQPTDLYVPTDFAAIKANADRLRAEVDRLIGLYNISQASVEGDAAPGYTALIQGQAARDLAASPDAPHGWPVKGPITSPFGPRQAIFEPKVVTNTLTLGQGGNPATPTPITTVALPDNVPPPTRRVTTPDDAADVTGSALTPVTVAPTPIPTITATITPTVTISPTPSTPTLTPTVKASPTVTATTPPTTGANEPGPGYDSTGIVVGPGMEFHTGIDIGVPEGYEVRATADGVIEYAGDGRGGYGEVVYINHPGGFMTIYGHNSRLLVKAGQMVKAGDIIALSGSTGYSTGPHVHYEVRYQSRLCNPAAFLPLN